MANKKRTRAIVKHYGNSTSMKSRKVARVVTSRFHELQRQIDTLKNDSSIDTKQQEQKIIEIRKEMDKLGGRATYQDASILSTKHFRTSRFVFQQLTHQNLRPLSGQPCLRVLEIGAINTQLVVCPWLDVKAIDVLSRDPNIEQIDFFDVKITHQPTPNELYDQLQSNKVSDDTADGSHISNNTSGGTSPEDTTDGSHISNNTSGGTSPEDTTDGSHISNNSSVLRGCAKCNRSENKTCTGIDVSVVSSTSIDSKRLRMHSAQTKRTSDYDGGSFDVVVNSMVVNCVTSATDRGKMLKMCYQHLRPGGRFFLMLPRRCVEQSAYMTPKLLVECLHLCGFQILHYRNTPRVTLLCCMRPFRCSCDCHNALVWSQSREPQFEDAPEDARRCILESNTFSRETNTNQWPWGGATKDKKTFWTAPPKLISASKAASYGGDRAEFAISLF